MGETWRFSACVLCGVWFLGLLLSGFAQAQKESDWPTYGNDPGGMRYSTLTQINRETVVNLKIAWTFHTGDVSDGSNGWKRSAFETTPIFVDGTLFLTTPFNRVIALDPITGKQRWAYDPKVDLSLDYGDGLINRGVATWLDPLHRAGQPCQRRVYEATLDARLLSLDAATGKPCIGFGQGGQIELSNVPKYELQRLGEYSRGWYHMTSPPAVIDDLVIVGSAIDDNARVDMPSGVVRAFDARTGVLRWKWDPIPRSGHVGPGAGSSEDRETGAANAWSIMVVDPNRDLVFVPTGSASPDYFGGLRPGDDKWANSVVALHAKTGALAWGFQLVHHDLWDYDTASPPLLATLTRNGKRTPVVVQGNKTGFLYVLDRATGVPVFPVEERLVPQSDIPGEVSSPTQPFPVLLPSVASQHLSPDDAWGPTEQDRTFCRDAIAKLRSQGMFTPPSVQGSLDIPGYLGGLTWSGYAFDPERALLVANVNDLPARVRLIPRARVKDDNEDGNYGRQAGTPYGMLRRFLQSPSDLPCNPPPWGKLVALDLKNGDIRWEVPLGTMQDFGGKHGPIPDGSISLGGPIVTAAGLVFIAGTTDPHFRAFDLETGKELWKADLPASGNATPMTYQINGKQYLIIAAGGSQNIREEPSGDSIVAFALPM